MENDDLYHSFALNRGTYAASKLQLYISKGETGELIPMNKKNLRDILQGDAACVALLEEKAMSDFNLVLQYNLDHPTPTGFIMNGNKRVTFDETKVLLED
jgi:hypothetical protein